LRYKVHTGVYHYFVHSSRDVSETPPTVVSTVITLDGDTGELVQLQIPTGEHSGNTIIAWLRTLHTARVFGLPYRILVFLLGLVIVTLSTTGVYFWWRKRWVDLPLKNPFCID
jgi:uncharacterized iron-regulated membrane protein